MKHNLFNLAAWFQMDPRRTLVIIVVILTLLVISAALIPNSVVLAGSATSGS